MSAANSQNLIFYNFLNFFRKSYTPEEIIEKFSEKQTDETDFSRICCPLCKWQPKKSSRWFCSDSPFPENFFSGCFTSWNTFETQGLCPGCFHQWRWTTCLSCHRDSLHEDWYLKDEK
ncbi:MAG: hypothetical protein ABI891_14450 [Acidobacteriota bacterium]